MQVLTRVPQSATHLGLAVPVVKLHPCLNWPLGHPDKARSGEPYRVFALDLDESEAAIVRAGKRLYRVRLRPGALPRLVARIAEHAFNDGVEFGMKRAREAMHDAVDRKLTRND